MVKLFALMLLCITAAAGVDLTVKYAELENTVLELTRQIMMQQFHVEEIVRNTANSGLKRVRNYVQGTRSYYSASHISDKYGPMHNHANSNKTLGWGEFVAVLNGVEFRTRHNDHRMEMKSNTSSEYKARQDIPVPDVPPEVASLPTVEEQVTEMREWFRAWAEQDDSIRPYKPYFTSAICIIEGMWTKADPETIQEPFTSDNNFLDATSWLDMEQKVRFTGYSGTKDPKENYAYLPTTIWGFEDNEPVVAQWNYGIICHPVNKDVPFNRFGAIEDLKARLSLGLSWEEYIKTRAVGYQYGVFDQDQWVDGKAKYIPLDAFMGEIPGADNYGGNIVDDFLGEIALPYTTDDDTPLNVAFYNRVYRSEKPGVMGLKLRRHGFNDEFLFVAQNTQEEVLGLPMENCDQATGECQSYFQRWSYAVPIEYVYMTPLTKWNPYNLTFKGDVNSDLGKSVYTGPDGQQSRDGSATPETCFNGINSEEFYMVPADFFGSEVHPDPSDTTRESVCVLDPNGEMRTVKASGYRIIINDIPGVGPIRQRYPCAPWDEEGQGVWKEIDALKDMFLYPDKYSWMVPSDPIRDYIPGSTRITFSMQPSDPMHDFHTHEVKLNNAKTAHYNDGEAVVVITEEADAHRHQIKIQRQTGDDGVEKHIIITCDGQDQCWDGHPFEIIAV